MFKLVKTECILAFCRSRLSGIQQDDDTSKRVFDTKKQDSQMEEQTNKIVKLLPNIDYINDRIANTESVIKSNMYGKVYQHLLDMMNSEVETRLLGTFTLKTDDEIVGAVIGLVILKNIKEHKPKLLSDDLMKFDYIELLQQFRESLTKYPKLNAKMVAFGNKIYHEWVNFKI